MATGKWGRAVLVVARRCTANSHGRAVPGRDRGRKAPYWSDLVTTATGSLAFSVWAPVIRDGQVTSVILVAIEPQDLTGLLHKLRRPEGWWCTVFDRTGTIVACSLAPQTLVGKPASQELLKARAQGLRGADQRGASEGVALNAHFFNLPMLGWTVAVAVPTRRLDASATASMRFMLAVLPGRHMSLQVAQIAHAVRQSPPT